MSRKIAVLVGSLRKDSYNRKMAQFLIAHAPDSLEMEIIELGELTMYNQDFDEIPPNQWIEFRNEIRKSDAILFVTPEYNRSVPGVLKNAIDIGSRPHGESVWEEKPAAVVSVSTGHIGGFGANHHLRQMLMYLSMPTMPTPEAYIANAAKLFDMRGDITVESTRNLMKKFIEAFADWVEMNTLGHKGAPMTKSPPPPLMSATKN